MHPFHIFDAYFQPTLLGITYTLQTMELCIVLLSPFNNILHFIVCIIEFYFSVSISGRGGQSALRFARLRMEKRHNYVRKVAETAVQLYITNDKVCFQHMNKFCVICPTSGWWKLSVFCS